MSINELAMQGAAIRAYPEAVLTGRCGHPRLRIVARHGPKQLVAAPDTLRTGARQGGSLFHMRDNRFWERITAVATATATVVATGALVASIVTLRYQIDAFRADASARESEAAEVAVQKSREFAEHVDWWKNENGLVIFNGSRSVIWNVVLRYKPTSDTAAFMFGDLVEPCTKVIVPYSAEASGNVRTLPPMTQPWCSSAMCADVGKSTGITLSPRRMTLLALSRPPTQQQPPRTPQALARGRRRRVRLDL